MNQSAVRPPAPPRLPRPRALAPQGELIDRIEYHVTQATDYVDYGRGELDKARDYMIKARKVMHDVTPGTCYCYWVPIPVLYVGLWAKRYFNPALQSRARCLYCINTY